jgi:hypothetical protein
MENYEPFDPLLIRALGSPSVALEAHDLADLLQQFELGLGMNRCRGFDAFPFPISSLITVIKRHGQTTRQDSF